MTDTERAAIRAAVRGWFGAASDMDDSLVARYVHDMQRAISAYVAAGGSLVAPAPTLPPEPPPGFVRARFPIAVGGDGKWAVQGGNGETDRAMVEATDWFAREGYPSRVSFIVVDAPTPEAAPVIVGVVAP